MDWMAVFLNALPMLLLIGVWIFLMRGLRRGGFNKDYQLQVLDQMKAQAAAMERIAAALEKRD